MTLIITAQGQLSNPAFQIPDLNYQLGFRLRASDIVADNGASLAQWVADIGDLPLIHREFNDVSGGIIYRSTAGPAGTPAVEIKPGSMMRNFSNTSNGNPTLGISEFTIGVVFQFTDTGAFVNNSSARLTQGPNSFSKTIRPSGGGEIFVGTGSAGGRLDTIPGADTDWIGVIFTGTSDMRGLISGKSVETYLTASTVEYRGLALGYAQNSTSIDVRFAEVALWRRALRNDELAAQVRQWNELYDLPM